MRYNSYSLLYGSINHDFACLLPKYSFAAKDGKVITALPESAIRLTPTIFLNTVINYTPGFSFKKVDVWIAEQNVLFNAVELDNASNGGWFSPAAITFLNFVWENIPGYKTLDTLKNTHNIK